MTAARAGACAAALVALATLYAGMHWGSTVGGGADSYGYVSQAILWRNARLTIRENIARQSPWPSAIETWAPLGYRPAAGSRDTIVPLYSPGLPVLMALFQAVGGFCAAFLVVPLCGALTVWLTYGLGRRLSASATASVAAVLLLATSPIFLYQLMNPMSDVPATAAWTLAIVLIATNRPLAAGLAAGMALLVRPNLVPLAMAILVWAVVARKRPIRFLIGLAPFVLTVAAVNLALYGAPWTSGYGAAGDLYGPRHLMTNIRQFGTWTVETQTPIVALALAYLVFPGSMPASRVAHPRLLAGGVLGAVLISYVFYIPFDAWWYLRFLLPMWPVTMVLVAVAGEAWVAHGRELASDNKQVAWERSVALGRTAGRRLIWGIAVVVVAANGLRIAADRSTFELGRGERRYVDVARFVAAHTDPDAVMIALQHSGTLRLYAGRLTLRFDQLDGVWLDRAVAFLNDRGRHPYIVVDGGEADTFRRQFAGAVIGRLDWRPVAMLDQPRTFVYDAVDRTSTAEPIAIAGAASRRSGRRCDPPYDLRLPLRTE